MPRIKLRVKDNPIRLCIAPAKTVHVGNQDMTYILVDEYGNEAVGVVVDQETVFDATENDIRIGKTAATVKGVTVGRKFIPSYHTTEGKRLIPIGSDFDIPFGDSLYDFTKLQAIICPYSETLCMDGSVAADKVLIDEKVYAVASSAVIATVTRDSENKKINLGIKNESNTTYVLRFFTYKEEH